MMASSSSLALVQQWTPPPALWWRGCQLVTMTTALISLYSFILMYMSVSSVSRHHRSRPILVLSEEDLRRTPLAAADNQLIDLIDFEYLIEPRRSCGSDRGRGFYFVFYVHSAPNHFEERQIIRSTWGSQRNVSSAWNVRVVFLLGLTKDDRTRRQRKIFEEHRLYDDLVQGNFIDSYHNLSYKHLMGYKWVTSRCRETAFIVKTDDDVFVDVTQLYWVLRNLYGDERSPRKVLTCSVWPSGSTPQRRTDEQGKGGKWAVPYNEYPYDSYPAYCGGMAYVVSPDVATDLLTASQHVPFFWIDDLYATGLLAETLPHLRHHSLNLRTTYDTRALLRWLKEGSDVNVRGRPCPFVFGDVSGANGNTKRAEIMNKLWHKTVSLWEGHRREKWSLASEVNKVNFSHKHN